MPRALVIGGSLGGLFAANLLADIGWEVEVFEKVGDDLAARGAGIGTHTELVDVLARLGITMDERLGVVIPDRICVDREGRELYRCHWAHTMSAWANVYRPLKDRFPAARYHFGKSFTGLVQQGKTRDQIYQFFMSEFGSQEPLASPIDRGFNRLAWAVPYALGLLGLGIATVVAIRWSRAQQPTLAGHGAAGAPVDPALEQRLADELRDLD